MFVLGFALLYGITAVWWVAHGRGYAQENEGIAWHLGARIDGQWALWTWPENLATMLVRGVVDPLDDDLSSATNMVSGASRFLFGDRERGGGLAAWATWAWEALLRCAFAALLSGVIYAWLASELDKHRRGLRGHAEAARGAFTALFGWGLLLTGIFTAAYVLARHLGAGLDEDTRWEWETRLRSIANAICFPFAFAPFLIVTQHRGLGYGLAKSLQVVAGRAALLAGLVLGFHIAEQVIGIITSVSYYYLQVLALPRESVEISSPLVRVLAQCGPLTRPLGIILGTLVSVSAAVLTVGLRLSLTVALVLMALRAVDPPATGLQPTGNATGCRLSLPGDLGTGEATA